MTQSPVTQKNEKAILLGDQVMKICGKMSVTPFELLILLDGEEA